MSRQLQDAHRAADDTITAAEQEAAEAVALVDALEEKVRDGDESVTADQLASARELGRFARLRAEAARRKAEKAKEQARLDALAELADEVRAADTGRGEMAKALTAYQAAVAKLVELGQAHNKQVELWNARAVQLGVKQGQEEAGVKLTPGRGLIVDEKAFAPMPLGDVLAAVLHRATYDELPTIRAQGSALYQRCPNLTAVGAGAVDLHSVLPQVIGGGK